MNDHDSIEFYSDDEIRKWYEEFKEAWEYTYAETLPGIPFSASEIEKEFLRRDRCAGALED